MGDNINVDFGSLGAKYDPNAFMSGYNNARTMSLQAQADHARSDALANPTDMNALTKFAVFDPAGGQAIRQQLDYQRQGQAREANANLFASYSNPTAQSSYGGQSNAPTPPQAAPQAPVDPLAPLPAQGAQSAPQGGAVGDPSHPVNQQIGGAAMQGRMDPMQAWAAVARYSDPAQIEQLQTAIGSMDKLRLGRISEANDALGGAAQSLLSVPQGQRAAALQQLAPQLMQHGITGEQLQQAMAQGLTDQQLQGFVGQALGTKGLIDQTNKQREIGQEDQKIALTGSGQQETARHNLAEERQAGIKTVAPGDVVVDTGAGGGGNVARTHGYTPSVVNGGDNSVAAVSNKVAALSKAAGVDPDTPMTPSQFASFVRALPATEGGIGARQNNPGNVKDGPYAKAQPGYAGSNKGYAIFNSPNAGTAAYAGLLKRNYYDKGQQSVRDIIEGRPTGGAGSSGGGSVIATNNANTLSNDAAESAAAIYIRTGQLPAGIARTRGDVDKILNVAATMQKAVGGKPGDIANNWQDYKAGSKAITAFSTGKQGDAVRFMNVAVDHLAALAGAAHALQNGNTPAFNSVANAIARATGKAAPTNFTALRAFVMDEVTKGIIGGGGGVGDREKAESIVNGAQSPEQLFGAIGQVQRLMTGQLGGLKRQYEQSTGRQDFERLLAPNTIKTLAQHGGNGGNEQIVAVNSPEDAAALPSGALFRTPDGRVIRKH